MATLPNPQFNISDRARSVLLAGIGASDTSLTVTVGTGAKFPASNFIIYIESEKLWVGTRTADLFTGLIRGYDGTIAATHASSVPIIHTMESAFLNRTSDNLLNHTHPSGGGVALPSEFLLVAATVWTNMPAALTEFLNNANFRNKADLTNVTEARVISVLTAVGASTTTEIRVEYSLNGTTWATLGTTANTPLVVIGNTAGIKVGAWVSVVVAAKADVYLRVVGINGNGAADPNFNKIVLQVK